ncbi:hypothetical protein MOBT1_002029 [Malassezia obtusa]|uniref:Uncharacterized protein n=1 Tax=Malassezia obtusa TaxID=76774 RepID=A0AAF0E1K1_9BASI|nr:hypothetical protein MOBT1_002029 [Malassezia obtusa]
MSMLARRVDKTDPRNAGAVRPLTMPISWIKEDSMMYETSLSGMSLLASSSIVSPAPDLTSLALVFSIAQLINIKPHAPMKDTNDVSSNAYASFLFAVVIFVFIALRKQVVKPAHVSPLRPDFLIHEMAFTSVHSQDDQSYLLAYRSLLGVQVASVAATPTYLLQAIRKGSFTMRGLARYNIAIPLVGAAIGAAGGWVEGSQLSPAMLARRVSDTRLDVVRARRDDYQLIGSVIGALSFPALFLRRVGLVTGLLGGAGLGSAFGVLAFYGKDYVQEDKPLLPASGEKPIPTQDVPK